MAEVIIIEIDCDPALYPQVNKELGLDMASGSGDWPKGLVSHVGAGSDTTVSVIEVWASKADQEAFMNDRLGPALGKVGVPQPKRMEWLNLLGQQNRS